MTGTNKTHTEKQMTGLKLHNARRKATNKEFDSHTTRPLSYANNWTKTGDRWNRVFSFDGKTALTFTVEFHPGTAEIKTTVQPSTVS